MSRTTYFASCTVDRTLRSMSRSSSSSAVSVANAPPAPTPALSAAASTGRPAATMRRWSSSTPSGRARSTWTASTSAPMPRSCSAAPASSASSAAITRSKSFSANCLASSSPMPLEAPVTTARERDVESIPDSFPAAAGGNGRLSDGELRDHVLAVAFERRLLRVVHQVDVELVDPELLELAQLRDVVVDRAEHAEAVDDLVGHERRVRVAGAAVVRVVVALPRPDVVGQRMRYVAVLPV